MEDQDGCIYPNNGESVLHEDLHNSVSSLSSNTNAGKMKSFPTVPCDLLPKVYTGIHDGYCRNVWKYGHLFNKAFPEDYESASPDNITCFDSILRALYVKVRKELNQGLSKRTQTIVTEYSEQYGVFDFINEMDASKIQANVIDNIGYSIFDQRNDGKINIEMLAFIMQVCKFPYSRDN